MESKTNLNNFPVIRQNLKLWEEGGLKEHQVVYLEDGEIVEVEYTIPAMDYRVKSLYLPKGSVVQATGQGY